MSSEQELGLGNSVDVEESMNKIRSDFRNFNKYAITLNSYVCLLKCFNERIEIEEI